jgi:hypothetical protein
MANCAAGRKSLQVDRRTRHLPPSGSRRHSGGRFGQRSWLTPKDRDQPCAEPIATGFVEVEEAIEIFRQIDHVVLLEIATKSLRISVLLARPCERESLTLANVLSAGQ